MKKVILHNSIFQGAGSKRAVPVRKNFHSDFKPHLTPQEMLELGVFVGSVLGFQTYKYLVEGK